MPAGIATNAVIVECLIGEVFNRKNLGALPALVADNVIDHQQIIFAQPEGSEGVAEGVRMFLRAFPDFHAEIEQLLVDGDFVTARLTLEGSNTGDYRGLPQPTNRHARWQAIAIFRIAAGKVAEIWGCADRMTMLTQLGILPDIG